MDVDVVVLRVLHDRLDQGAVDHCASARLPAPSAARGPDDRAGHTGRADVDVRRGRRFDAAHRQLVADLALPVVEIQLCGADSVRIARSRHLGRAGEIRLKWPARRCRPSPVSRCRLGDPDRQQQPPTLSEGMPTYEASSPYASFSCPRPGKPTSPLYWTYNSTYQLPCWIISCPAAMRTGFRSAERSNPQVEARA